MMKGRKATEATDSDTCWTACTTSQPLLSTKLNPQPTICVCSDFSPSAGVKKAVQRFVEGEKHFTEVPAKR